MARFAPLEIGAPDELLRGAIGLMQIEAAREACCDGGRERAAGAVRVARGYARRSKMLNAAGVGEHVDGLTAFKMSALDQCGLGAEVEQATRLIFHVRNRTGRGPVEQVGCFMQIGRDEIGERDQLAAHGRDRIGREQHVAAGRHHDRVDHERRKAERREARR